MLSHSQLSHLRVDGPKKVVGAAKYTADYQPAELAYAALVCSPIARGRIVSINVDLALRQPGVLGVVSHLNAASLRGARVQSGPTFPKRHSDEATMVPRWHWRII